MGIHPLSDLGGGEVACRSLRDRQDWNRCRATEGMFNGTSLVLHLGDHAGEINWRRDQWSCGRVVDLRFFEHFARRAVALVLGPLSAVTCWHDT